MPETKVVARVDKGVLRVELGSEGGMNLLSVGTRKTIWRFLKKHESNKEVACVIITSRGRVFSAGADLKEILSMGKSGAEEYSKFVQSFLEYVEGYPKPTMALVDGVAVGGALELLMTLDIVLASPESRFGQTELNVGLIPGGGGTQRLPRLVGVRAAKEMIYTGRLVPAKEASEMGLVTGVVDAEKLEAAAEEIVDNLRKKNPRKLSVAKMTINKGLSTDLAAGLKSERRSYLDVLSSKETRGEITDFLERNER